MTWPKVIIGDDGIRPKRPPDECFYCHQKVGQEHGRECAVIRKRVQYDVLYDNEVIGTYTTEVPCFWTKQDAEFHKNDSSWCAGNSFHNIQWAKTPTARKIRRQIRTGEFGCGCNSLTFIQTKVVHPGPLQDAPKPPYRIPAR